MAAIIRALREEVMEYGGIVPRTYRQYSSMAGRLGNGMYGPGPAPRLRAGISAFKFGVRDMPRAAKSFGRLSFAGMAMMNLPLAAFSAGQAPRGQRLSTFASGMLPMIGTGVGQALFGLPGALVGGALVDTALQSAAFKGFQSFMDLGRDIAKVEMGGDYQDTEVAYTMRQRASREMSGSLMNARQYLGREARMLHA